ncbi:RNA polymerase sigma factor [Reticulibacter mediterranei]|uniref:RNA polymerase sigma factor n=1 Tax=Reticulibacter mediterranei TaxID=2778369 RepID=A0A8J3IVT0_9CHLR|nr:sigma-70 family RNA polymerase sigma factor [Reticulibacter mediterranei]GHO99410.1 RNA polymerase sigma factor [Reticulibacter mediterranei]
MNEHNWLVERFETERPQLMAMAYRMLGSLAEAEDAVQESWLHLCRVQSDSIKNMGAWLTTTLTRICLDMLRSRQSRREEPLGADEIQPHREHEIDPEQEVELADAVGIALLVVLDTLSPAERLAFVLHDIFAVPFDEIAPMLERSETAVRQLASRARRRVRGASTTSETDLTRSREMVTAFLAASRAGDFETLLTLLDPDVLFQHDRTQLPTGALQEAHGAIAVARTFVGKTQGAWPILVNGSAGIVIAPHGQMLLVATFTITNDKITAINTITDPAHLSQLDLAVLDDGLQARISSSQSKMR